VHPSVTTIWTSLNANEKNTAVTRVYAYHWELILINISVGKNVHFEIFVWKIHLRDKYSIAIQARQYFKQIVNNTHLSINECSKSYVAFYTYFK